MNDRIQPGAAAPTSASPDPSGARWRPEVLAFIDAHRRDGHRSARLDPLGVSRPADPSLLDPQRFGLQPGDWLSPAGTPLWNARTVGDLDRTLKAIYAADWRSMPARCATRRGATGSITRWNPRPRGRAAPRSAWRCWTG